MAFFGRGKNKIQAPLTFRDSYESLQKEVIKGSPYDISLSDYKDILFTANKEISNMIIDEGESLKIPNLGVFDIVKYKMKLNRTKWIPVDFQKSAELGQRIINLNEHTKGYKYTFRWSKIGVRTACISYYRFVPTRRNKRHLAYILKNNIRDYFEKTKVQV